MNQIKFVIHFVRALGLVVACAVATGCPPSGSPPSPGSPPSSASSDPPGPNSRACVVVGRATVYQVDTNGFIDIDASCLEGEQMRGGGYELLQPSNDNVFPYNSRSLSVVASYPLDDRSWRVRIFNPDGSPEPAVGGGTRIPEPENQGRLVRVESYCFLDASTPLGMKTATITEPAPAPNVAQAVTAPVPSGAVVTGGGFSLDYSEEQLRRKFVISYNNGYVLGSTPDIDEDGNAIGWRVLRQGMALGGNANANGPLATAYVRYATQGLTAGPVIRDIAHDNGLGYPKVFASTMALGSDEFTSGGGYEMVDVGSNPVDPAHGYFFKHLAIENHALLDLGHWRFQAIWAQQFPGAYPNGHPKIPTQPGVYTRSLRLKLVTPHASLVIASPAEGAVYEIGAGDPATTSVPIHFAAVFNCAAGLSVAPQDVKWTFSTPPASRTSFAGASPLGTGLSFDGTLPLRAPAKRDADFLQYFTITASAVVNGQELTDSRSILVQWRPIF